MVKLRLKIRPMTMRFLLWALLIFTFVDTLSRFNILNLTGLFGTFIPVIFASAVLIDVGFITKGKRKMSILHWALTGLALLVLLGVLLQALSVSFGAGLNSFIGLANSFL